MTWKEWSRARPPQEAISAYREWRADHGLGADESLFDNDTVSQQCLYWCHGWMTARGIEACPSLEVTDA